MKRPQAAQILVVVLFLAALVLGTMSQQRRQAERPWPRAQFNDATPLGGKGLRLLFEWLGYPVWRIERRLTQMPPDARVWVLLDHKTTFSRVELKLLLDWVNNGGTLLFALPPTWADQNEFGEKIHHSGLELAKQLHITKKNVWNREDLNWTWEALPPLSPLTPGAPGNYWADVKTALASQDTFDVKPKSHFEIAGNLEGAQLARLDVGQGRVFVAANALLFTSYALDAPDTAVLVTNLVRAHVQPGAGSAVYFDERKHGETAALSSDKPRSWAYYLWQPPLRFAVLQIAAAALLMWMLFGRRLGAPVPLPDTDPVTRASHFAQAMGALLHKSRRPRVVAEILGDEFRRNLAQRLGMSPHDTDEVLAARASQVANLPAEHVVRLLRVAKAPAANEEDLLNEVQQMESVLRRLSR